MTEGPSGEQYAKDRKSDQVERRRDPGPSGTEYEADKREASLRRRLAGAILIAVTLLAVLNIYGTFVQQPAERRDQIENVRMATLKSCREAVEPMRLTLIKMLSDQIAQSARISPELFPDIPREQFHELQSRQQAERKEALRDLRAIPSCSERFAQAKP